MCVSSQRVRQIAGEQSTGCRRFRWCSSKLGNSILQCGRCKRDYSGGLGSTCSFTTNYLISLGKYFWKPVSALVINLWHPFNTTRRSDRCSGTCPEPPPLLMTPPRRQHRPLPGNRADKGARRRRTPPACPRRRRPRTWGPSCSDAASRPPARVWKGSCSSAAAAAAGPGPAPGSGVSMSQAASAPSQHFLSHSVPYWDTALPSRQPWSGTQGGSSASHKM